MLSARCLRVAVPRQARVVAPKRFSSVPQLETSKALLSVTPLLQEKSVPLAFSAAEATAAVPSPDDAWYMHFVHAAENSIMFVHDTTGLPWWASIVATTVAIRIMLIPPAINAQKTQVRLQIAAPEIQRIQKQIQEMRGSGRNSELSSEMGLELREVYKRHNIKFSRMFMVPLLQAPIFISLFWALYGERNLPAKAAGYTEGGFGYLLDLTQNDPFLLMPVIACGSMMGMAMLMPKPPPHAPAFQQYMKPFMIFMSMVSFALTARFPVGLFFYWNTNNIISLIQTAALKNPSIRTLVGIPSVDEAAVTVPPPPPPKPDTRLKHQKLSLHKPTKFDRLD